MSSVLMSRAPVVILLASLCIAAGECSPSAPVEEEAGVDMPVEEVNEDEHLGELVGIRFLNAFDSIEVGQVRQLLVFGDFESGNSQSLEDLQWESDSPDVATVENGRVTGQAHGSTRISATKEGYETDVFIRVVDNSPTEIQLRPNQLSLDWESEATITATVFGASGPLSDARVLWQTRDPRIATVSQRGVVKGVSPGETTLVATHASLQAEVDVIV
ncbi:MAG: Ig-like domain-containing protein, partial [Bradymonadaceae bacterium]